MDEIADEMDERLKKARARLEEVPRNKGFTLIKGNLYRIRSRNLPYGVYDGLGGFIGIRQKFGTTFLFAEYDWDDGPPFGTVVVLEDLGPSGIEPVEGWWGKGEPYRANDELYKWLAGFELSRPAVEGYGTRVITGEKMNIMTEESDGDGDPDRGPGR